MRLFLVALTGLAATAPNGAAGDGIKDVVKASTAPAEEPIRLFGPNDRAKGVIVAVDEGTQSFDLRTPDGIVRARNPLSIQFVDRNGKSLTGTTLSKGKEYCYMTIVLTDATVSQYHNFRYLVIVEALP